MARFFLCNFLFFVLYSPSITLAQDLPLLNLQLLSINTGGTPGVSNSNRPVMSEDGRFIAYHSNSNDLSLDDDNCDRDIFLFDSQTNTTTIISRLPGSPVAGSCSNLGNSSYPSISADGRFIAFLSSNASLVVGDSNARDDVFVFDRINNTIERVSISSSGTQINSNADIEQTITANGRFVVFSAGGNIATPSSPATQIYLRDRQNNTTTLVSKSTLGGPANGNSRNPYIDRSGSHIIYLSDATDIISGDNNGVADFVIYDIGADSSSAANLSSSNQLPTTGANERPFVTGSGRYLVFPHAANNLVANDNNSNSDLFVRDTLNNSNSRESVDSNGNETTGLNSHPRMSEDGRFVVFRGSANNLVSGDSNGQPDVFMRDRLTQTTYRFSVSASGDQANGTSAAPFISANGRYIGFSTIATNILPISNPPGVFQVILGQNPLYSASSPQPQSQSVPTLPYWALLSLALLMACLSRRKFRATDL